MTRCITLQASFQNIQGMRYQCRGYSGKKPGDCLYQWLSHLTVIRLEHQLQRTVRSGDVCVGCTQLAKYMYVT